MIGLYRDKVCPLSRFMLWPLYHGLCRIYLLAIENLGSLNTKIANTAQIVIGGINVYMSIMNYAVFNSLLQEIYGY